MTCGACARARAAMPAKVRLKLEQAEQWFEARRREQKALKRATKDANREPIATFRATIDPKRGTRGA